MNKNKKSQAALEFFTTSGSARTKRSPVGFSIPRKKGQAALEFLTTYGWAFLVVLVMIGALAYFGVLNPSNLLPDKCVFGAGIGCADYVGFENINTIKAQVINGFGYTITLTNVKISVTGVNSPGTEYNANGWQCCRAEGGLCGVNNNDWCRLATAGVDWKADEMREIAIGFNATGDLKGSDRPRVGVTITYTKGGSSNIYAKNIEGVIQVRPN